MKNWAKVLTIGGLALLPWAGSIGVSDFSSAGGAAWAQDDDDDGDDDDDDDDDDGGDDDTPPRRQPTPVTPRQVAPRVVTPVIPEIIIARPEQAPDQIVVLDLSDADLATLLAQGFGLIETRPMPGLATVLRRVNVPQGLSLTAARDVVRALASGQNADFNHYYRSEQDFVPAAAVRNAGDAAVCDGEHCPAFAQVGWPVPATREQTCGRPVAVGMIDTGLNPEHATFAGADLTVLDLRAEDLGQSSLDPSRAVHGTAVAALLLGDPASRSPGLIPHARLVAVDAFYRADGDERADVAALADALGQLAEAQVGVINLSLAGPANSVLEEVVTRLIRDNGITIVAAAGNDGPAAPPVYPAAYPGVIAVTAVDATGDIYRRAGQGPHVTLAAPGVGIWTAASVSGARDKTGTSFAAPFVTAAATLLLQSDPSLTPADVAARLTRSAVDLGAVGPDPVFGFGLVTLAGLCDMSRP